MQRSLLILALAALSLTPALAAPNDSAQQQVAEAIKAPGISVVHLWAPWCSNCQAELRSGGWTKTVKANPNVKFYFVSIWDKGDDGRAILAKYELTNQPNVTVLADPGPRGSGHITEFAGLSVSWIPSTWVFKGGNLFYAMNYGELHFPVLQQFIADSDNTWEH